MKYYNVILAMLIVCTFFSPTHSVRNNDLEFNDAEKAALEKLRPLVKGQKYDDWIKGDWSLMHYLRAKNLDPNDALTMMKETIRWRRENKMDSILGESVIELSPPYYTDSTAKDGSPLMIWLPGRWDIRKLLLTGNREKLDRYFEQMTESTFDRIRKSQAQGGNVTQWIHILDVHGYNLRQHACVNCLPMYFDWVAILEKHYPGVHQHFYHVNTPRIFTPLLNILKPLYSVATRKALKVIGVDKAEWQAEWVNLIADEEMPKILGGKKKNWF